MIAAITAFFQSLNQAIKTYETHILQQGNTELVKSKKRLKKASDITEEILDITDRYSSQFDKKIY